MKTRNLLLALLAAGAFSAAASAQVVGYNFRTGDAWVDTELGHFSDYGRRDRGYFVDDLVDSYGAPRYLVNELLDKRRWDPGDVYYAAALAYQSRRPLGDVAREFENSKGQGWGVVAMRMGIKPGSAEFHALKGQMGKSKGRYQAHGDGGPPAGKGKSKSDGDDRDDEGGPGNSGNGGKGKDKGHGQGQGGSEGKGKGKSKGKPD
jgi:hypothetical protein